MKLRSSRIEAWSESMAASTRPSASAGVRDHDLGHVLERQGHRVERLDDPVVEVPTDPVALLDDREVGHLPVQPRVLDRDRGVEREDLDEPLVVRAELGGPALSVR